MTNRTNGRSSSLVTYILALGLIASVILGKDLHVWIRYAIGWLVMIS